MGVVVPSMSRSRTRTWFQFPGGTRALFHHCLRRDISRTPADWLIVSIQAAAGVVRSPAGTVLEQTDRPNAAVTAQIEPVQRAARHANQVAGFHFESDNGATLRMDMEKSPPCDDIAHFIFVVAMLDVEFRQRRVEPGRIGMDVDHVSG